MNDAKDNTERDAAARGQFNFIWCAECGDPIPCDDVRWGVYEPPICWDCETADMEVDDCWAEGWFERWLATKTPAPEPRPWGDPAIEREWTRVFLEILELLVPSLANGGTIV